MRKKRPNRSLPAALPTSLAEPAGRSPFFSLLYDQHGLLLSIWDGKRIDWRKVCRWAEAEGKLLTNGQAPTPRVARRVWDRVLALKRREAAGQARAVSASVPGGRDANLAPNPRQPAPKPASPEAPRSEKEAAALSSTPPPIAMLRPQPASPACPRQAQRGSDGYAHRRIAEIREGLRQRSQ